MKKTIKFSVIIMSLIFIIELQGQPILADFQVNENTLKRPGQFSPLIIACGNNNYMISWKVRELDDIFAQKFSSDGTPFGDKFYLKGFPYASDKNGNFVVIWKGDDTFPRLFAQLFDSNGTTVGEEFQVTEYAGNATEYSPSVSFGANGSFTICLISDNPQSLYGDIFARRFAPDCTPLGSEFKVNDDSGTMTAQGAPNISSNKDGEFIIAWNDSRVNFNGGDIYAQRYDSAGVKIGSNFHVDVDNPEDLIRKSGPKCSLNDSGNFVITWDADTWERTNPNIFAQLFDWEGKRSGSNFKVTDAADTLGYVQHHDVAMNEKGKFLITWLDDRNNNSDIFTQYYGSDGTAIGSNTKINNDDSQSNQWYPGVVADNNGDFILTWEDNRNNNNCYSMRFYDSQIYVQKFAENGSLIEENFHIPNETPVMVSTSEKDPSIVIANDGTFTIVWYDQRDGKDIYAQRYQSNGVPMDTNFRVNDELDDKGQFNPAAAINSNDKLLVSWRDTRNGQNEIFAQLYSDNGDAMGSNFKVNDDSAKVYIIGSAVSELGDDNFIVVWHDTRNGGHDIYARRIDGSGGTPDSSFKVNDDPGSASYPAVAVNDSGTFLIAWSNYSPEGTSAIYAQLYSSQGAALGANFKINNTSGGGLRNTAIAALINGQFVVVWSDYSYKDIYAQRIAGNGTLIDSTFLVGPDAGPQWQPPAVAADEAGNFIIAWTDNRNQVYPDVQIEVFAQRFNNEGIPIGSDFSVSGNNTLPYEYTPAVKLFDNKIYTTWAERDRFDIGTGVDIWANVLDWNNSVGINDDNIKAIPAVFSLGQNYPNPFNPTTAISYQLPARSAGGSAVNQVELNVYNVLGQKVATLVSGQQIAGQHQVNWNANGFSSGVYFYRIQAGSFSKIRKMILLK